MLTKLMRLCRRLGSVEMALFSLGLMMILIFFGTLAQAELGTFAAQKKYFSRFFLWLPIGSIQIPVFPAGFTIGGMWLINLVCAFIVRFRPNQQRIGIFISHAGLIVLLLGQFFTQILAKESQMPILEGETTFYSENVRRTELALTRSLDEETNEEIIVPLNRLRKKGIIKQDNLPFKLTIHEFYKNAELEVKDPINGMVTQGIGNQLTIHPRKPTVADNEYDNSAAIVEISDGEESLGVWLTAMNLGQSQFFTHENIRYQISLRPQRHYNSYSLTLKDFRHDRYDGTNIPKNFSSFVHLIDQESNENRDVLIYMNHPLRYKGKTYYQASFGEEDTLSVLQVVENPAWLTPYVACILVVFGLGIQFLSHLKRYLNKKPA